MLATVFSFLRKYYPTETIVLVCAIAGLVYVLGLYTQTVGVEEGTISRIHIILLDRGYSITGGQVQIISRQSKEDELLLKLDLSKSRDSSNPESLMKIITNGPLVSDGWAGLNIEERDVWNTKGEQHRLYVIKADKEEKVGFLQSLKGSFFNDLKGQVTLSLRLLVDQTNPPPPIAAYFYVGDILVSTISPTPDEQLPAGGVPHIIGFRDGVSKEPNYYPIQIFGSDVGKLRTIQGSTFTIGIFVGIFTGLIAGALIEILRTTLKMIEQ